MNLRVSHFAAAASWSRTTTSPDRFSCLVQEGFSNMPPRSTGAGLQTGANVARRRSPRFQEADKANQIDEQPPALARDKVSKTKKAPSGKGKVSKYTVVMYLCSTEKQVTKENAETEPLSPQRIANPV